jgi:hypothetical protein
MKKSLLTERFQQLAGIKPLYENERLNEGVPLEKLMKGDKFNNDVLVVPNISFKDEKELRRKAMRPVDFNNAFGPRSQVEFTNVGGEPGTPVFGVEDGVVQNVILFDDALKSLNELEVEQSQTDKLLKQADILTDDERDYAFDVLSKMHKKLNPTLDVEKTRLIIDFAEAVLQEFYE